EVVLVSCDFSGVEPEKLARVAELMPSFSVKISPFNRPFLDLTASPSVFTLRSSASGGLKTFSGEKVFKNFKKTFVRFARKARVCDFVRKLGL
ncbi:MAG: hypothetical protein MSH49_01990, partial [[Eubacterium] saphenum]|nr:hypothetical protein [[Eubacterium] saphenum]